jgi:hypothetical protein
MKKITIIILVILFLIVCFEILFIKKQVIQIENLHNNNWKLYHHIVVLKNNIIDSWQFERNILQLDSVFDENGERLSSEYLRSQHPILIFRFSKVDCSECVVKQIDLIKRLVCNDKIKYMMIGDYSNKRNLGLFKRTNAITNPIYNCEKMVKNENKTPYFCIYFNGYISNVFFPDDDFPELTESYFKKITEKYF